MITYQIESWADFLPDGEKLFPLHWKELAVNQDKYSHAMNYERYAELAKLGMLHVTTVRMGERLVGYVINFLIVHMHYSTAGKMALTDMYYLLPEFRKGGCGAKMFMFMEKALRDLGITQAHTSCKVHQDHQAMFEALGWSFTDKTFMKYLGSN